MTLRRENVDLGRVSLSCLRNTSNEMAKKPALLFVHGLGDSALAWRRGIVDPRLREYDAIAVDLAGYGQSQVDESISLANENQINRLFRLLERLGIQDVVLVGHSMGGVLATLMAAVWAFEKRGGVYPVCLSEEFEYMIPEELAICGVVNVEGNLTSSDAFISGRAVLAERRGNFERWYRTFAGTSRSGPWAEEHPEVAHYGVSLAMCSPHVFLASSMELNRVKAPAGSDGGAVIGEVYRSLEIPTRYFHGTRDLSEQSRRFIERAALRVECFDGAGHWLMNERHEDFYDRLLRCVKYVESELLRF